MCTCVVEHRTSLKLTWPTLLENSKQKKKENIGTWATVVSTAHHPCHCRSEVQGLGPGFLPSLLQACLSWDHLFISGPSGLSARVCCVTLPSKASKSLSFLPLNNLYPSFLLLSSRKQCFRSPQPPCWWRMDFPGSCWEAPFYDLTGLPCNWAGPHGAFSGQAFPHILCFSCALKHLDNSIWCIFPELFHRCKKTSPSPTKGRR